MTLVLRILVILALLPVAAFCAFGFLATFEPPGSMGWRLGYAIAGVMCLLGAAWAAVAKSTKA